MNANEHLILQDSVFCKDWKIRSSFMLMENRDNDLWLGCPQSIKYLDFKLPAMHSGKNKQHHLHIQPGCCTHPWWNSAQLRCGCWPDGRCALCSPSLRPPRCVCGWNTCSSGRETSSTSAHSPLCLQGPWNTSKGVIGRDSWSSWEDKRWLSLSHGRDRRI